MVGHCCKHKPSVVIIIIINDVIVTVTSASAAILCQLVLCRCCVSRHSWYLETDKQATELKQSLKTVSVYTQRNATLHCSSNSQL